MHTGLEEELRGWRMIHLFINIDIDLLRKEVRYETVATYNTVRGLSGDLLSRGVAILKIRGTNLSNEESGGDGAPSSRSVVRQQYCTWQY